MGNNQENQKVELIWIDAKVNNDENKKYKAEISKAMSFNFSCFEKIPEAIKYLKKLEFISVFIICSGRLYPEFIKIFKTNINDFSIIPKIVIFCGSRYSYLERNKNNLDLPINHPFYNAGGVQDSIEGVKNFLFKQDKYNITSDFFETLYSLEDKIYFEAIINKDQLILPFFFSKYLEKPPEQKIQQFNKMILSKHSKNNEIKRLIEQLIGIENIPYEMLYKYWLKAYSIEEQLYLSINEELKLDNFKDYLVFVSVMYEGAKKNKLSIDIPNGSCLYRYTYLSKAKIDNINLILSKTKDYLPYLVLYSNSFLSFDFDKKKAADNNNNNNNNNILLIIENVKNNLEYCSGYTSLEKYNSNKKNQIFFFPFSFFEIIKIEKKGGDNYNLYLGCIGRYENLFKGEDHNLLLEKIPESSSITREIINNNIIDKIYMDLYSIITIKYDISALDTKLTLFGQKFVENNNKNCYMIINGQNLELKEEISINEYKKENGKELIIKLAGLNRITDMSYLFNECHNLIEVPNISKINTSQITNMCSMFRCCEKLASLPDISKWNTSSVTDMSFLFSGCSGLQRLPDISKWITRNVVNMSHIFESCSGLQLLPNISKWTADKFENISYMFYDCKSLGSLPDISKWEIKNVKNKDHMFDGLKEGISKPEKFL